jgi:hypothetical protein
VHAQYREVELACPEVRQQRAAQVTAPAVAGQVERGAHIELSDLAEQRDLIRVEGDGDVLLCGAPGVLEPVAAVAQLLSECLVFGAPSVYLLEDDDLEVERVGDEVGELADDLLRPRLVPGGGSEPLDVEGADLDAGVVIAGGRDLGVCRNMGSEGECREQGGAQGELGLHGEFL